MTVPHNAVIIHEQAGAGGFGDPMARDIGRVFDDLLDGKISEAFAQRHHGVVLDRRVGSMRR
jgi:N-methylhydantoinase B